MCKNLADTEIHLKKTFLWSMLPYRISCIYQFGNNNLHQLSVYRILSVYH